MAKARAKRSIKNRTAKRFVEPDALRTTPKTRTVFPESVDVEARTLTAVVATGTGRTISLYDDETDETFEVEEVIAIDGMDFSRVETGLQFLDSHDSFGLEKVLGVVTDARVETIESGDAVVVDVRLSKREGIDDILQDLADGILGCISCQYSIDESILEDRDGQLPLGGVPQISHQD